MTDFGLPIPDRVIGKNAKAAAYLMVLAKDD
jgi:hypothetical protein